MVYAKRIYYLKRSPSCMFICFQCHFVFVKVRLQDEILQPQSLVAFKLSVFNGVEDEPRSIIYV